MALAEIIELLKLAGPVLSAILLWLYQRQRLQVNAGKVAIESVIQVNTELRLELTRMAAQITEQRENHNAEFERVSRLWSERNTALEIELKQAHETIFALRNKILEWEKVIRIDTHDR